MDTATAAKPDSTPSYPGVAPGLLIALGVSLILACVIFRDSLVAMVQQWNAGGTYAHGYLIPLVTAYLLYQQRADLAACEKKITGWGGALVALGAVAWAMSALVDIQLFEQFAAVATLLSIVLLFLGHRFVNTALFPLLFLFLAVPVGDGITPHLIDMTADFVVAALRVTGIPVYREGASFVIPSGSWSVVTACSGIRYLMATVTIGTLYAYLNFRSYWRRAAFVGVAVIVAVVGNWLRAYLIVMIGHLSGMRLAVGIDHVIYGWVFFGLLIFLLMGIGMLWSEPPAPPVAPVRGRNITPSPLRIAGACSMVIGSLLVAQRWVEHARLRSATPAPQITVAASDLGPAWSALPTAFTDWRATYAGEPVIIDARYRKSDSDLAWQVAWYGAQHQGSEIINAGTHLVLEISTTWRMLGTSITLAPDTGLPARLETVIENAAAQGQIVIWQWYWIEGRTVLAPLWAKFYEILARLQGHGNAGATVLVYTSLNEGEELSDARARLAAATQIIAPRLATAFAAQIR